MSNQKWEQHGDNWIFTSEKNGEPVYGYVIKVRNLRSYKIEVWRNGLGHDIGRKQTVEMAKKKVENYFGIKPVEVLRAPITSDEKKAILAKKRRLTFCEEILARQERRKLSERGQKYNHDWNMCEKLPYKDN